MTLLYPTRQEILRRSADGVLAAKLEQEVEKLQETVSHLLTEKRSLQRIVDGQEDGLEWRDTEILRLTAIIEEYERRYQREHPEK